MKTLICEVCQQPVAMFDPENIKLPLSGDMFLSHAPDRGVPAPFHSSLGVFDFRCPWCQNLPFHAEFNVPEDADPEKFPARLKTTEGYFDILERIKEPAPRVFKCRHCGKEYQHKGYFKRHEEKCQG